MHACGGDRTPSESTRTVAREMAGGALHARMRGRSHPVRVDEDVGALDVAVEDAAARARVQKVQPGEHHAEVGARERLVEGAKLVE